MAKSSSKKPKSLTALAKTLDTRKLPLPAKGEGRGEGKPTAAQRAYIENALRSKAAPLPAVPAISAVPKAVPKPVAALPLPPKLPPKPAPVAPRPISAPQASTLSRPSALSSLQRSPSPVPSRMPTATAPKASAVPGADPRRQYPRAEIHVRSKLSLADDPSRFFEASLPTVNLSVGGMFLESSFFLKMGTRLLISLELPQRGRAVSVKGEVVRVETNSRGQSGFAVRFTEYLDGSQVILATHFLSPVLKEFLGQYAKEHRFEASAEYLAHTADVLAAWELKKAELGGDVWNLFPANS